MFFTCWQSVPFCWLQNSFAHRNVGTLVFHLEIILTTKRLLCVSVLQNALCFAIFEMRNSTLWKQKCTKHCKNICITIFMSKFPKERITVREKTAFCSGGTPLAKKMKRASVVVSSMLVWTTEMRDVHVTVFLWDVYCKTSTDTILVFR